MEDQKIFFSYSRVDGESFAMKLADDLRKAGVNIWVDQQDISPGKLWDLEIEKALENSNCVLFIASEKSTTSNNVLNEVYYALEENKEVIPVIISSCKIPFRLSRLQHIDFIHDYNRGFEKLLKALEKYVSNENAEPGTATEHPGYEEKDVDHTSSPAMHKSPEDINIDGSIDRPHETLASPETNYTERISSMLSAAEKGIQNILPVGRGNSGEAEYPGKMDLVFNAVCTAVNTIKGMKVASSDKNLGRILVSTKTSLWSWGENIYIQLTRISDHNTKVSITSHKIGMKYADALDFGKNKKNVEQILIETSKIVTAFLPA